MFKIIFFVLFFLVTACANQSGSDSNNNSDIKTVELPGVELDPTEVESNVLDEQKSEIYKIEKKSVIFFIISKREAQNIAKEIGESYKWETEALFTSFSNQSKTFIDILKKHNINSSLCTNKQFEIKLKNGKVVNFDRIKEDQILGEILSNGEKEPLIRFGMYDNQELAELIQEYFGIKNLGYVPSDSLGAKLGNPTPNDSVVIASPSQ